MLFVRVFSNKQNKPCTTVALVFLTLGFFSREYRSATFDSFALSFRARGSVDQESMGVVLHLVLKPAEDLDPGSIPG